MTTVKERLMDTNVFTMILKMSAVTMLYILLTVFLWKKTKDKKWTPALIIGIGLIYGICSILSTHFAVNYVHMLLNVRDIGPLAAGLFFHPISGIIAGLIGGIERYIAGTYWGIGSYTRIACSVSTCLAGFLAAFLNIFIFKRKKPAPVYALFMGAVMEVFHMYVVLITHRSDMKMAYYVVQICSYPMIIFTGLGLCISSIWLQVLSGEWKNPFKHHAEEEYHVADRFQRRLFIALIIIFAFNFAFSFMTQSQKADQNARDSLALKSSNIIKAYNKLEDNEHRSDTLYFVSNGSAGTFDIIKPNGTIIEGNHKNFSLPNPQIELIQQNLSKEIFKATFFNIESVCKAELLDDGMTLLTMIPMDEVYEERNIQSLETTYADILLLAGVYILISFLVQELVVNNLNMVNESLNKITKGNLNEIVTVRSSSEFASLSDDINQTVDVLKGYIDAAEKRYEEELELAYTIQDSALPKNFVFPRNDFEIYATMDPAKEVGGDFYDFFFTDKNKFVLVIADVSGKGIPASLFMMRSKTAIRSVAEEGKSPAEIFYQVNNTLCEGNDAEMFVTAWIGIIDLETGLMQCANAGHEYPALMRSGGEFELLKDKHSLALAAMPGIRAKEYELQLQPGDRLFVYTDGVPEAINELVEQYGDQRMLQILNRDKEKPMEIILPDVRKDISDFVGKADQFDDITMLGFTWKSTEKLEIRN